MPNPRESSTYITYILRCWQEGTAWRYSLEEVGGGERHGFASLDEFVAFMLARATPAAGAVGRAHHSSGETVRTDKSKDDVI